MMTDQQELFDSRPYYVEPPVEEVKIKVKFDSFYPSYELTLRGLTLDLYKIWKETGEDCDEEEFLAEVIDDLTDEIVSDIYVSHWTEVE